MIIFIIYFHYSYSYYLYYIDYYYYYNIQLLKQPQSISINSNLLNKYTNLYNNNYYFNHYFNNHYYYYYYQIPHLINLFIYNKLFIVIYINGEYYLFLMLNYIVLNIMKRCMGDGIMGKGQGMVMINSWWDGNLYRN